MASAMVAFAAATAFAQVDNWEFEVYPAATLPQGMVELESLNSFSAKGHEGEDEEFGSNRMYRTSFELTYGLTDRIEAAAYLNLAHPNGSSLQYSGSKYRLRGSLFEQGQLPVDLGWYLELEWNQVPQFDESALELEFRPILTKQFGRLEIDLNPKFEKPIVVGPEKNHGFEFGYASGIYYNYWRWMSPGLEFYGGIGLIDDSDPLNQQQHYIFPVVRGELPAGIEYNIGVGIGLTKGSDQIIPKLNIELERFVGALL
jgi:hypothetical protein